MTAHIWIKLIHCLNLDLLSDSEWVLLIGYGFCIPLFDIFAFSQLKLKWHTSYRHALICKYLYSKFDHESLSLDLLWDFAFHVGILASTLNVCMDVLEQVLLPLEMLIFLSLYFYHLGWWMLVGDVAINSDLWTTYCRPIYPMSCSPAGTQSSCIYIVV